MALPFPLWLPKLSDRKWVIENLTEDMLEDIPDCAYAAEQVSHVLYVDEFELDFYAHDRLVRMKQTAAAALLPLVHRDPETFGPIVAEAAQGSDDPAIRKVLVQHLAFDPCLLDDCLDKLEGH